MFAALNGQNDIVKTLIKYGAYVNATNDDGKYIHVIRSLCVCVCL